MTSGAVVSVWWTRRFEANRGDADRYGDVGVGCADAGVVVGVCRRVRANVVSGGTVVALDDAPITGPAAVPQEPPPPRLTHAHANGGHGGGQRRGARRRTAPGRAPRSPPHLEVRRRRAASLSIRHPRQRRTWYGTCRTAASGQHHASITPASGRLADGRERDLPNGAGSEIHPHPVVFGLSVPGHAECLVHKGP